MMEFLLDPNVAYVLLMAGFVIAILAMISPGTGVLEVIALFVLFLAGYALLRLPVRVWALALIVLSAAPFIISLRLHKHWWLLALAAVLLITGTIFLYPPQSGNPAIHPGLAVLTSLSVLLILWIIGRRGLEAVVQEPAFDLSRLVGQTAQARDDFQGEGTVYVGGEEWTARSSQPVKRDSLLKVTGREGLVLLVEETRPDADNTDPAAGSMHE